MAYTEYTGRLCTKEVPFRLQVYERVGSLLVAVAVILVGKKAQKNNKMHFMTVKKGEGLDLGAEFPRTRFC